MDNHEFYPNDTWDEYRWERYLRENDRRCDRFASVLEAHLSDPSRDRIIAREMGWHHLLEGALPPDPVSRGAFFLELIDHMLAGEEIGEETPSGQFPEDDVDFGAFPEGSLGFGTPSLFTEEDERLPDKSDFFAGTAGAGDLGHIPLSGLDGDDADGFGDLNALAGDEEMELEDLEDDEEDLASHPLCDLAATYQAWLERLIQEEPQWLMDPLAARLTAYSAICGAKVCAALEGDEFEELGMTIAYLKRGLKAINTALEAAFILTERSALPPLRADELRNRIFRIRDGIIELMGYYRMEWMRRAEE